MSVCINTYDYYYLPFVFKCQTKSTYVSTRFFNFFMLYYFLSLSINITKVLRQRHQAGHQAVLGLYYTHPIEYTLTVNKLWSRRLT